MRAKGSSIKQPICLDVPLLLCEKERDGLCSISKHCFTTANMKIALGSHCCLTGRL